MKIHLACCVIADEYGRVLLLHRAGGDVTQWELPGGAVRRGEVPESVAVLEAREQLGADIRLTAHLGSGEYEDDEHDYVCQWFQGRILIGEPVLAAPGEFDDLDYFEPEDLMSLALAPAAELLLAKIVDGDVAVGSSDDV